MSKTVRGILQAGLSVAASIPGPQQPFIAGAALAFSVANLTLFNKSPPAGTASQALRTPRPERVSAYGRAKRSGGYFE